MSLAYDDGLIERQQDEIERLRRALDAAAVDNEQYRQANDLLTRELAEAREALRVYGRHLDSCGDADAYNHAEIPSCGCGFDAAMQEGER